MTISIMAPSKNSYIAHKIVEAQVYTVNAKSYYVPAAKMYAPPPPPEWFSINSEL